MTRKPDLLTTTDADLLAQHRYVEQMKEAGYDFGITLSAAFVRGIRDLGYKHTGTALDEHIDNADQAGARTVHVFWEDAKKPQWIAVADDGHGMEPEMIRLAMAWGGTHRENSREGFGRYGYGLPSAAVSQGHRFTVFARVGGDPWHAATLDLDLMEKGAYSVGDRITIPEAKVVDLPDAVQAYLDQHDVDLQHGTIVLLEKLDRLTWKQAAVLKDHLLEHFGLTYRNFLRDLNIVVNGTTCQPVDPLFLTPDARYYDEDEDRAEALQPKRFIVTTPAGDEAQVVVRYAYMPPRFGQIDKTKERGRNNKRFRVRADNNGLIVLRNHRQIDVVPSKRPLFYFNNDDRYVGVEVDFPAALDEEFSITTSKQSVAISDRMYDLLKKEGVFEAVKAMRKRYDEEKKKLHDAESFQQQQSESERAMADFDRFARTTPKQRERQRQLGEETLKRKARKLAEESGRPTDQVEEELRSRSEGRPYEKREESHPGAPFYRVEQEGGTKVLYLNTAHSFYKKVYKGEDTTPRVRRTIEVLLFVLGSAELTSEGDRARFYLSERAQWSTDLEVALDLLDTYASDAEAGSSILREEEADATPAA